MSSDTKDKQEIADNHIETEEFSVPNPKLLLPDKVLSNSASSIYYSGVDEISVKWLYSPHTITALVILLGFFVYSAFFLESKDPSTNAKYGFLVVVFVFVLIGIQQFRDGPFIRPHPAFWRLVLSLSIIYLLILVFILFQDKNDVRKLLGKIDNTLGIELPEKSYGDNCDLTFQNVKDQVYDIFVLAHFLGWFGRALILRDYWFCWVLSVLFEFCEYSLQHLLPNFNECWWDHWILDVLTCNWFGIWLGMKTCKYFEMKQYSWRGFNEIETTKGKIKRAAQQFTPHHWTKFEWGVTKSFKNFLAVLLMLVLAIQLDLNGFFLKYLLWIPSEHMYVTLRLILLAGASASGTSEAYRYLMDKTCKKLGTQAWVTIAILSLETIICFKYSKGEFHEPTPKKVKIFWLTIIIGLVLFALYQFALVTLFCKNKNNQTGKDKNENKIIDNEAYEPKQKKVSSKDKKKGKKNKKNN
ncbi:PSS-domain-containing protein [Anaeromyces robustus]|uniref:PSS-domain-containing protein n=1 Tax=Anaeromyces robustus TaxID=1754192 RepID=A0A1Y1XG75_9FUNG|nr:PSS-domain-containing protein [Anaeromyces robustus]|eukprot:ORX84416.1 PSS-domain-containing protein [Anaeromyces robustus]